jgi:3-phosphoshikimate 1-carboxyvinyltransferase
MKATFSPSVAKGTVMAPPSKSMAHRALIAAALAEGESFLFPVARSEDMLATIDVLNALGACITRSGEGLSVKGMGGVPCATGKELCCRESGSTLRFAIPLALLTGEPITFVGSPRLMERPLEVYEGLCRERGFFFERKGTRLTVCGRLLPGEYSIPGHISSQFVTGMLFALSLLQGPSCLRVTGTMESAPYVDMTLQAMDRFGVSVKRDGQNFFLPPSSGYRSMKTEMEGDWSNAAFLDGFSLLGGEVRVLGLWEDSLQGDRVYRFHYEALKKGFAHIDLSHCPDLGPGLMALAAACHGACFTGTKRLKIKESDRGEVMARELRKCGVAVTVGENEILVKGGSLTSPAQPISSHNDHRIAMAMSLLLSRSGGELEGAEAVNKSFPEFFDQIKTLGIEVILQ